MLHSDVYHVTVEGIEFYAHHGVTAEEQAIGHRYELDLRLQVNGAADVTDLLEDTVDYGAAVSLAVAVSDEHRFATLEALARAMADRLLGFDSRIVEVEIRVAKRLPPIPYVAESAAVELTVTR